MKNGQKWPEEFSQAIDLLALKSRLTACLINATTDYLLAQARESPGDEGLAEKMPRFLRENIPLKRTKDIEKTSYISAIAFKLQIALQKTPAEIAQGINSRIKSAADFTVYVRAGWIQFQLTELGLANWLQHLSQWNPQHPDYHQTEQKIDTKDTKLDTKLDNANNLFLLEYTHARCCSLLRLGQREQLIKLSGHSTDWQIIKPSPIPWLNEQNQLRLNSLTERTLISRLITTLDTLSKGKNEVTYRQIVKLATDLSQDLLIFYAANRIWNETKTENLALAQARLGLILTTQIVLKLLLEKGLGILPPQEM